MVSRPAFAVALVLLAACGGAVSPDTGPSTSSSSGGSSSGSSSSGSSSGSTSSSSGSSSGGVCTNGQVGGYCSTECAVRQVCVNGQWVCEGDCPPPPPRCAGPTPVCGCPAGCECAAQCEDGVWVCETTRCQDGGLPFDCGDKDCKAGEVCTETASGVPLPDAGPGGIYYQCVATPPPCANNDTCACVVPALKSGGYGCYPTSCSEPYGNVVVQCMGL